MVKIIIATALGVLTIVIVSLVHAQNQMTFLLETVDFGRISSGKWVGDAGPCGDVVINANCGYNVENYDHHGNRTIHNICGGINGKLWFRYTPEDAISGAWRSGKTIVKTVANENAICIYNINFDRVRITPPFDRFGRRNQRKVILGFESEIVVAGHVSKAVQSNN